MPKSENYPYLSSQVAAAQWNNESEEGGLNLGQVGAALRRRALLITGITGVVATAAVLKAETDPPIYQGQFEILTESVTSEGKVVENVPQTLGIAPPESAEEVKTTIKVLKSPLILDPVVAKLQKKYPHLKYKSFVNGLVIESPQKDILTVGYVAADKQLVSDVLNEVAEAYMNYSSLERQKDIDEAIKFVVKETAPLRQQVNNLQAKVQGLRRANNFIEPAQKTQEVSANIATLTQQRITNRVEYEQMLARYEDLQKELARQPGERAGNSVLSENTRYQKILDQIQQVDIQIQELSAKFTDINPSLQTLRQNKANLLPMLSAEEQRVQKELQSQMSALRARDSSLEEKINALNSELKRLATVTREYDEIQRQLKIATDGLNQFATKYQSLKLELAAQEKSPWELLDPKLTQVEQPQAISDSAKRNLALGGMLGLLVGVGAALVVDKLSNIFYSSKDLKESTKLPLLGVVPWRKELADAAKQGGGAVGVEQAARASFFEVFRSLYTNILLLGSDAPIRSLVISSASQGDGKSTVAIHLALAAAAMGQKVLLVDANLRGPSLHNRVGLMNIQGLTDIISSDLEWSNVIERSPLEDNLHVMAAGPIPPDSTRLLASIKMQDLMNELHHSFDLVIYDTPPLLGFADANLLAAHTNGIMLVAGLGKLKRTVFQQALEEIQISGTPVLGIVANKSKETTPGSHEYYERYYKESKSAERVSAERVSVEVITPR